MYNKRFAARVDSNQKSIVAALRKIPGVTVEINHDDILVGHNGMTYWFELKNIKRLNKSGGLHKGGLQDSQIKLLDTWQGHYEIVTNIDEILKTIKIGGNNECK